MLESIFSIIRPVLRWACGKALTQIEMISDVLGFKVVQVYESLHIDDARFVEDEIQRRLINLELETHRLFRGVGYGKKYRNKYDLPRVHRVFFTYSDKIAGLINAGIIIVDDTNPEDYVDAEDITVEEQEDEYDILETDDLQDFCDDEIVLVSSSSS